MSADVKEDKVTITKEELTSIEKDIADAKAKLVSKDTQEAITKAKEEGKEQATKEAELQKKAEEAEKKTEELQKQLEEKEKLALEKLEKMESKINEMVSSKQIIAAQDPFNTDVAMTEKVDKMSDEEVNNLEERSARQFFGVDYDNRA